jgi:hypothetical protein
MTVSAHVPGHPELDQAPGDPAQSPQNCESNRISNSTLCMTFTVLTVMSVEQVIPRFRLDWPSIS